jgi:hypothetical protein
LILRRWLDMKTGMTRARIIVLVGLVASAAVVLLVPATRDGLDWYWAETQDQAPDYLRYLSEWPKGRHANEAKMRYEQRQWASTKRALILQAYQQTSRTNTSPDADAAYRRERRLRRENLFWRQATNANTLTSYQDYLQRYPRGQFVAKARLQIEALTHNNGQMTNSLSQ